MKKMIIAGVSILIATTVSAALFNAKPLFLRCHEAAIKIDKLHDQQDNDYCKGAFRGDDFEYAGQSLVKGENYVAKSYLANAIASLTYAKGIGCKDEATINWGIAEANAISKAIT